MRRCGKSAEGTGSCHGIVGRDDSISRPHDPLMTVFPLPRFSSRDWHHLLPIALGATVGVAAITLVAYLLWPTWEFTGSDAPERLPISIGSTLFNVPTAAIRMKIQRHSGPQERIDLSFAYPSLEPAEAPKHVSAEEVVEEGVQPIDRVFLSISAHHDTLAPDILVRTIYPR